MVTQLLEQGQQKALLDNKLRQIMSVGEPLLSDIPREWTFGLKHNAKLVNVYGQTETAGPVATYAIPARYEEKVKIVPIGRPIANMRVYILDPHLHPVPIGEPGEMYIGGPDLARCYLNQPELTVEKFISNPFSDKPEARLYKTGDLARYLPDGNIEFLGRVDYQIKIRG